MTPYVHNTDHEAQHICCRTFAGELEDATAAGRPNLKAPPSGPAAVRLPASVALVSCLDRAAAPHVYLPHLADRWVVCVCVCVCAYACACACVHACLCVSVCVCVCMCVCVCICECMCVRSCVLVCECVCVCVCVSPLHSCTA